MVKNIDDLLKHRIRGPIQRISQINLATLPSHCLAMSAVLEANVNHRKTIEKQIEKHSMMIEKATVQLIEIFVDMLDIGEVDKHGERVFRLPRNEVDEDNWKIEQKYPIDKYDWLIFGKIFQQIFQYPELKRQKMCTSHCDTVNH